MQTGCCVSRPCFNICGICLVLWLTIYSTEMFITIKSVVINYAKTSTKYEETFLIN